MCYARRSLQIAILQLVLMGVGVAAVAQGPPPANSNSDPFQWVTKQVERSEGKIEQWDREAAKVAYLTVLAAILGAVVAVAQATKKESLRIATAVMGVAITGITVVNNTVYHPSRTLRLYASELREAVNLIRVQMAGFDPTMPADGKQEFTKRIADQLIDLTKLQSSLEKKLEGEGAMAGEKAALGWLPHFTAYAQFQSQLPAWVSNPPTDNVYLYFTGKGEGPSLQEAEEQADLDGYRQGARMLAKDLGESELAKAEAYVARGSEEAGRYFQYERSTRNYRFFKLWRISKVLTERVMAQRLIAQQVVRVRPTVRVWVLDRSGRALRRSIEIELAQRGGSYKRRVSIATPTTEPVEVAADGAPQGHYVVTVYPRTPSYTCPPSSPFAIQPAAPTEVRIVCRLRS